MNIKAKVVKTFDKGTVKAVCDVTLDNAFVIHGVKLIKGQKGDFISMPSDSWKNSKGEVQHTDIVHPMDANTRATLYRVVSDAYYDQLHPLDREPGINNLPFGM